MTRRLDLRVEVRHDDGTVAEYGSPAECAAALGITERQARLRATDESVTGGISYRWANPSTKRSLIGKRSRRKGNAWELELIGKLKAAGYPGCVSSRSESKRVDDAKVDIMDTEGKLPCHIQAKNTANMPNYHKVREACPLKDKPFVLAVKQKGKTPLAVLPLDYFCELISRDND